MSRLETVLRRNFQHNAIEPELGSVPGIGNAAIIKLNNNGITKTDHLIGNFFLVERDEGKFIDFLLEVGLNLDCARECARAFTLKFGQI